jgi:hypothetical protein
MAHATPRATDGAPDRASADRTPADPTGVAHADSDEAAGGRVRRATALAAQGRDVALDAGRHLAGRLRTVPDALPRLAAAGAARVRERVNRTRESAAEREAHRRELALEAAEAGPGTDWAQVGVFSAGIAVGALIGAGAALLLAPATGYETRARLADRARRSGGRFAGRWDEFGDDVRHGARRGRKRVTRAVTASRWAAEDAWERRRRTER